MAVDTIDLTYASSDSPHGSASEAENSYLHIRTSSHRSTYPVVIDSGSSRRSSVDILPNASRAPISPPPLKRTPITSFIQEETRTSHSASPTPPSNFENENVREMNKLSVAGVSNYYSRQMTPSLASSHFSKVRQSGKPTTPHAQTPRKETLDLDRLVDALSSFRQDVKDGHSQLAAYTIDSTIPTEHRALSGPDLFANANRNALSEDTGGTMRVKFKQHFKSKKDQKEGHYQVICIKTDKEHVPRYRFHHVEIKKNVLTPNTMLTFVPHLRDLESSEESKYNVWLQELEDIDRKSGFKPMGREDKVLLTRRSERAATVSLYLESWLERLDIPGCNKSTLIRHMASREPDTAITPRQKTDLLKSHQDGDGVTSPGANKAAEIFTEAFQKVFRKEKQIELRDVLLLEESVDSIMDSKPMAKDGSSPQKEDEDDLAEFNLGTYCILGCLICFSHSCEHGEYDASNCKRTFSMIPHLSDTLKSRRQMPSAVNGLLNGDSALGRLCHRNCHLATDRHIPDSVKREWTEDERIVLRSIFNTAKDSRLKKNPMCLVAEVLDRDCCDVMDEYKQLDIHLPQPEPPTKPQVKSLAWYDRFKKALMGDWQDQTLAHEHQRRELPDPCSHEGPCTMSNCGCVQRDALCEKFCGCSVSSCSYKFNGCACHSQGKTCYSKQKERPCICVQLNRECDPELCGSCGVLERADPENTNDEALHSWGCQNCVLQRGATKALVLGQSQLEGVGYGLFTAEKIAQEDFIIEYVGELITHDEGVRREARRGDVFDEESKISYLFTLLEFEGIWVDAAIYGNLSRYINHASEHDKRGCNITPRILYVNGEYRIKFTAMRDIEPGEELFFNYGENFTGLTKKLLDDKAGEKPDQSKRRGQKPQRPDCPDVPRKAPRTEKKKPRKAREARAGLGKDGARKRKRDEADEEEYHPTGTGIDVTGSRHVSPSTGDSDAPVGKPLNRLRQRARARAKTDTGSTENACSQPKVRGKRGGARPGSGRPRKHPRPTPLKPPSQLTTVVEAADAGGSTDAGASVPEVTPASTEEIVADDATASIGQGLSPPIEAAVTVATDESSAIAAQMEASAAEAAMASNTSWKAFQPTVEEIEDSEDGRDYAFEIAREKNEEEDMDGGEDEDEDQDVFIRKRRDRATRNRRPPAKFRWEDESARIGNASQ